MLTFSGTPQCKPCSATSMVLSFMVWLNLTSSIANIYGESYSKTSLQLLHMVAKEIVSEFTVMWHEITSFKCAVMKQPSFTARGDKFKDKRFKW